jgi:putative transposase
MPRKYSTKLYVTGGHYHLYNRGTDKRKIFLDDKDYRVFLNSLKQYLSPISDEMPTRKKPVNLHQEVELLAYCLMPNHYHLLVRQSSDDGIVKLIRRVATSYSLYFNKRYDREGTLFQGKYKGILVDRDSYLVHLSRYIHLNPHAPGASWRDYPYSSYKYYLSYPPEWLNTKPVLDYFKSAKRLSTVDYSSYQAFMENYSGDANEILENLTLE